MVTSPSRSAGGPRRRRQRSVRVTLAVTLLSVATLALLLAVPTNSATWMGAAALLSVVCGWASVRVMHNELSDVRRQYAADRATQTRAFRELHAQSSEEHLGFATAMRERLATSDRAVRELSGTLTLADARAAEAQHRARREKLRADTAESKVSELRVLLTVSGERPVPGWEPTPAAPVDDVDTVVDLLAWEERAGSMARQDESRVIRKHA